MKALIRRPQQKKKTMTARLITSETSQVLGES